MAYGFDFGYWTRKNENWYQERRANILRGRATVETISDWKLKLKGTRKGHSVRTNYETKADATLANLLANSH